MVKSRLTDLVARVIGIVRTVAGYTITNLAAANGLIKPFAGDKSARDSRKAAQEGAALLDGATRRRPRRLLIFGSRRGSLAERTIQVARPCIEVRP